MKKRFLLFVTVLMGTFSTIATAQTTDNLLNIAGLEPDPTGKTTYYLKNVGTGLYMSYGGEHGTHCIESQQAHPIVVEQNGDHVAIGSIGGYLESNTLWMDSTKTVSKWTLVKAEGYDNQYYLYGDGDRVLTSVGNSAGLLSLKSLTNIAMQRWIFTNGADIKNDKMPNASVDAPFDVTVSIRGGAFDLVDGWDQESLKNNDTPNKVPEGIRNSTSIPNPYHGNWANYTAYGKWIWDCGTRDWDPNVYAWCGIINGNADALTVTYTMTLPKGTYHFSFEGFYKYMKVVSEQKQTRPLFGSWSNDGNPTITTTDNGTMNASVSIAGQSFALKSYGSDNSIYDNGALTAAVFRDNDTYEHHCTFYVSEESQEVSIVITKPSTTAGGESTSGGGTFSTSRTVTTTSYPSQIYIDDFTLLYYGADDVTTTAKENANYISYLNANIAEYKAQFNDEGDAAFDEAFTVNINNVVTRAEYYNALATLEEARKAGVLAHLKAEALKNAEATGDYTKAIVNHSFEMGDLTGWELPKGSSVQTGVRMNAELTTEGADGVYLFNSWWNGMLLTQTIAGLPNGVYRMSVLVASGDAGNDGTVYLIANDQKLGVNPPSGGGKFGDYSLKFEVTDGTATIGTVGGNDDETPEDPVGSYNEVGHWWYKCDNFRLDYLGDDHLKLDQTATKIEKFNEDFKQVTINRSLAADRWYTFVVPFDMEIPNGWTVKELSGSTLNDDKITLEFTTVDSIKAGVPYMVRTNSAVSNGDITSMNTHVNTNTTVEAPSTKHVKFVATYTSGNVPEGCYFISNNVFYRAADETNTIKGFRAYFEPIGEAAKARQLTYRFASDDYEEGTTAIDDAQFTTDNAQTIVYDLMGRRIENPTKGIYIVNGKKVMIKE